MYCQDRTRQERLKLTILDKERIVPGNCIPDLGIFHGPMKSGFNHHVLSNNSADIESYLFGIGSTNFGIISYKVGCFYANLITTGGSIANLTYT